MTLFKSKLYFLTYFQRYIHIHKHKILESCFCFAFCVSRVLTKINLYMSGLEFQGGIRAQNLEIPSKRITRVGDSHSEKFLIFWKLLLLWNEMPRLQKIWRFSCNAWQFLSVCDNFLLPIRDDNFPILRRIECISIWKFGT